MARIPTHYDVLKVDREAPAEVIRAAYKALSQKHHPDRNQGNPDAVNLMLKINAAYETLSDPARRAEHDRWIREQEHRAETVAAGRPSAAPATSRRPATRRPPPTPELSWLQLLPGGWLGMVLVVAVAWLLGSGVYMLWQSNDRPAAASAAVVAAPPDNSSAPAPADEYAATSELSTTLNSAGQDSPAQESSRQDNVGGSTRIRTETAPNGEFWPALGYVSGYEQLASGGASKVTVKNTADSGDVYLRLVSVKDNQSVRHVFIPARSSFTMENLVAGDYVLKYKDLDTERVYSSETLELVQSTDGSGPQSTTVTVSLEKTMEGSFQTRSVTESL